jgi:hypothetical protein
VGHFSLHLDLFALDLAIAVHNITLGINPPFSCNNDRVVHATRPLPGVSREILGNREGVELGYFELAAKYRGHRMIWLDMNMERPTV